MLTQYPASPCEIRGGAPPFAKAAGRCNTESMQRVFTSPDPVAVHFAREVLADSGIMAEVRNEAAAALRGEVPCNIWPELWVSDGDADAAKAALAKLRDRQALPRVDGWRCPVCGEELPQQFVECWRCAAEQGA